MANKSGIHINPANRGKFTDWAKHRHMTAQEAARMVMSAPKGRYSSSVRREANFARNAKGFKH